MLANVCGFELSELTDILTGDGETLIKGNIYYEGQLVGEAKELPNDELDFTFSKDVEKEWEDALHLFCEERSALQGKNLLVELSDTERKEMIRCVECELFYYLITVKEWEEAFREENTYDTFTLVVFEAISDETGCRTGSYKLFATKDLNQTKSLSKAFPTYNDDDGRFHWRFSAFEKLDDFDIRKETA